MNMLTQILQRFPANFNVTEENSVVTIRDTEIEKGCGYFVTVEPTLQGHRANIRFEDFALQLFKHAEARLETGAWYHRALFSHLPNVSLRVFRQTVETLYQQPEIVDDGLWIELAHRNDPAEFSFDRFLDVLVSVLVYLFPYELEGEAEGGTEVVTLTRAERSLLNRSLCLAFHGYGCRACGLNMHEKYGDVAYQFIHVHHLVPVSAGGSRQTDPINDMVPLCPNCHSVAHLRNPPYAIEEIESMITQKTAVLK